MLQLQYIKLISQIKICIIKPFQGGAAMELSQLRYFKALAENGNMTKTAEQLFISPSSLSLAMSRLEKELGTTLFDRIKGRIYLNDCGRVFLAAVTEGLDKIDCGGVTAKSIGSVMGKHISIATTNQTLWNGMIADFIKKYPEVHISHQDYKLDQLEYDSLLTKYDFILTGEGRIQSKNLDSTLLFANNDLMVMLHPDHPLSGKRSIRLEELKDERFIFPPSGFGLNTFYRKICHEAGFEPNVVAECGYVLMSYLHQQGIGILFTSRRGSPYDVFEGSVIVKVEDVTLYQSLLSQAIYWDKRRRLSSTALLFRDFASEYFSER